MNKWLTVRQIVLSVVRVTWIIVIGDIYMKSLFQRVMASIWSYIEVRVLRTPALVTKDVCSSGPLIYSHLPALGVCDDARACNVTAWLILILIGYLYIVVWLYIGGTCYGKNRWVMPWLHKKPSLLSNSPLFTKCVWFPELNSGIKARRGLALIPAVQLKGQQKHLCLVKF